MLSCFTVAGLQQEHPDVSIMALLKSRPGPWIYWHQAHHSLWPHKQLPLAQKSPSELQSQQSPLAKGWQRSAKQRPDRLKGERVQWLQSKTVPVRSNPKTALLEGQKVCRIDGFPTQCSHMYCLKKGLHFRNTIWNSAKLSLTHRQFDSHSRKSKDVPNNIKDSVLFKCPSRPWRWAGTNNKDLQSEAATWNIPIIHPVNYACAFSCCDMSTYLQWMGPIRIYFSDMLT